MGIWVATNDKRVLEAEQRLLSEVQYEESDSSCVRTLVAGDPSNPPLLLVHGFGTGAAFWYRQIPAFSRHFRVYSVDWLRCGVTDPKRDFRTPESTENALVESIEKWRRDHKIERFSLVGHSLGGLISACYAIKYPAYVERLVLASPAGVPEKSSAEERMPSGLLWNAVRKGWEWGLTPQDVVRLIGPYGPKLVRRYTEWRYPLMEATEKQALHDYMYHVLAARADHAYFNKVFAPGAWAHRPLLPRAHLVTVPTLWLYGRHDWMDWRAGEAARLRQPVATALELVPDASHQLFLDNPDAFNRSVLHFLLNKNTHPTQPQS